MQTQRLDPIMETILVGLILQLKREGNDQHHARGDHLRGRAVRFQENAEHERGSLFHMNREIKKAKENNVEKLMIGPEGQHVIETDPNKCKDEAEEYFGALFSGRVGVNGEVLDHLFLMDDEFLNYFLNDNLAKLSEEDKEALEGTFNEDELKLCFHYLQKNKTPG